MALAELEAEERAKEEAAAALLGEGLTPEEAQRRKEEAERRKELEDAVFVLKQQVGGGGTPLMTPLKRLWMCGEGYPFLWANYTVILCCMGKTWH
jgi:hypothetical protein